MKAHKVPATYYASWKIPGTKHSFYVFYKDKLYSEGQSKSYKDVDKITQEHSFFMEENFYYLDIENMPGLAYKLQNEIEERDFTATVGGGAVEVVVTGKKTIKSLTIKPEVVDKDDIEMLQDLIISAVNEAVNNVEQTTEEEMSKITGGVSLPGLF